jgi:hypothetical protein
METNEKEDIEKAFGKLSIEYFRGVDWYFNANNLRKSDYPKSIDAFIGAITEFEAAIPKMEPGSPARISTLEMMYDAYQRVSIPIFQKFLNTPSGSGAEIEWMNHIRRTAEIREEIERYKQCSRQE